MHHGEANGIIERCARLLKVAAKPSATPDDQRAFQQAAQIDFKHCQGVVDDALLADAQTQRAVIAFMRATPTLGHRARIEARRDHPSTQPYARKTLQAALDALAQP